MRSRRGGGGGGRTRRRRKRKGQNGVERKSEPAERFYGKGKEYTRGKGELKQRGRGGDAGGTDGRGKVIVGIL